MKTWIGFVVIFIALGIAFSLLIYLLIRPTANLSPNSSTNPPMNLLAPPVNNASALMLPSDPDSNRELFNLSAGQEIKAIFTGTIRYVGPIKEDDRVKAQNIILHNQDTGQTASYILPDNAEIIQGLVLWAAYPANNNSLVDRELAVASIYGAADGLAIGDKIAASRSLLPADTQFGTIKGGNHAQMGWYGPQGGDGVASINREAQQRQVVDATLTLLAELEK